MSKIVTSCRECKFSIFSGKKQTGCRFGLLEQYKEAGVSLLEGIDEDEKEFYLIDRICIYSRPHISDADVLEVLEQSKVNYQVIITIDPENTPEHFEGVVNSWLAQSIKPQHISAIKLPGNPHLPPRFTKYLERSGIRWRFENALDGSLDQSNYLDMVIDQVTYPYYVDSSCWYHVPKDFSVQLHDLVNVDFKIFTYLIHPYLSIVPTIFHKQLGGNAHASLLTKIKQEEKLTGGVYAAHELIPCLT
jgi:hypothetical protein